MKLWAVALALAIVLAGCTSGKGKDDDDGSDGSSSTTRTSGTSTRSSTSGTGTGSGAPGTIAVDLTRSTPDGAVPLQVNLTVAAKFSKAGSPATPGGLAWTLKVFQGNLTQPNATLQRSGASLPANVTLNLTTAGNHTFLAEVTAPGYTPGNDTVLVLASPGGPGAPIFYDGAEGDASQWTITSNIYIDLNLNPPAGTDNEELDAAHPEGGWVQVEGGRSGKAWGTPYPDNYRTRMTSVALQVPAGGASLSYWIKGGAEANSVDGIHVLVGADELAEVAYHTGVIADWTQFTVSVPAGEQKVQFRYDSDVSCSNEGPPAGGENACGAGFDGGGLLLDDITVA